MTLREMLELVVLHTCHNMVEVSVLPPTEKYKLSLPDKEKVRELLFPDGCKRSFIEFSEDSIMIEGVSPTPKGVECLDIELKDGYWVMSAYFTPLTEIFHFHRFEDKKESFKSYRKFNALSESCDNDVADALYIDTYSGRCIP